MTEDHVSRLSGHRKKGKVRHVGDWARFLRERHLLILDWIAEGQTPEQIAHTLSMDPVQVQLIGMTLRPSKKDRYALC